MNIVIQGANENNLKNLNIEIPLNEITTIIGPSGSGKSTLAHQVIGNYALRKFKIIHGDATVTDFAFKPDVEHIHNLLETIIIKQDKVSEKSSSTIATYIGIQDNLIQEFCKHGKIVNQHGETINKPTKAEILSYVKLYHSNIEYIYMVLYRNKYDIDIAKLVYFLIQNKINQILLISSFDNIPRCMNINKLNKISKQFHYTVLIPKEINDFNDDINIQALGINLEYAINLNGTFVFFERDYFDIADGSLYQQLSPQLFSFNSLSYDSGKCDSCNGTGVTTVVYWKSLLINNVPLKDGFLNLPMNKTVYKYIYLEINELNDYLIKQNIDISKTINELNNIEYETIKSKIELHIFKNVNKEAIRRFIKIDTCASCGGSRLNYKARAVKLFGRSIFELLLLTPKNLLLFCEDNNINNINLVNSLKSLIMANIEYLSLNRTTSTLSGGELQRLKLACEIQNNRNELIYIIDEPSCGLHPHDVDKLASTLLCLRNKKNTILLIEHNYDLLAVTDNILELGYGAGYLGGYVVDESTQLNINKIKHEQIKAKNVIPNNAESILLRNVNINNINNQIFRFPLNCLVCVTGVSGSGKSSLIHHYLFNEVQLFLNDIPSVNDSFIPNSIKQIVSLSQSNNKPTSRSIIATYLGLSEYIRKIYASIGDAYNLSPSLFSFNSDGACDYCNGIGNVDGVICPSCLGSRFKPEVLTIRLNGKSINELLDITIQDIDPQGFTEAASALTLLIKLGLGHLSLGCAINSLSGGERQRIRIAELIISNGHVISAGGALIILDEISQGLGCEEIFKLLEIVNDLIAMGNSVICIEHNKTIIQNSDYIVDIGPLSGVNGGKNLYSGSYNNLLECEESVTAKYLKNGSARSINCNKIFNSNILNNFVAESDNYVDKYPSINKFFVNDQHFKIEKDFARNYSVHTDNLVNRFFKTYHDLENFCNINEIEEISFNPYTNHLHKFRKVPVSLKKKRIKDLMRFFPKIKAGDFNQDEWEYRVISTSLLDAFLFGNGWVTVKTTQHKYELFTRVVSPKNKIVGSQNISPYTFNLYANRCAYCNGSSKLNVYNSEIVFNQNYSILDHEFFIFNGMKLNVKNIINKFRNEGLFDFTKKFSDLSELEKNIFLYGFIEYEFLKPNGNKTTKSDYLRWKGVYKYVYDNLSTFAVSIREDIINSKRQTICPFCIKGFNMEVKYLYKDTDTIANFIG